MEDSLLLLALMRSSFPCVEERGREERGGRWKEAGEEWEGLSPPTEELMEVENKP